MTTYNMENLSIHEQNQYPGGQPPSGPPPQGQRGPLPPSNYPPHPPPRRSPSPGAAAPATQGPPQLPPQMFTTAAQLLDLTDKKLVLVLRDGRKLIGVLRTWDQFANLVLQNTVERIYANHLYADMPREVYLVRGENVLMLGEIDLDKEDNVPEPYQQASWAEVFAIKQQEETNRKNNDKRRRTKMQTLGFESEHTGEVIF